ncbi:hypothetical protein GCM10027425_11680 [Alteromonas gracilis]
MSVLSIIGLVLLIAGIVWAVRGAVLQGVLLAVLGLLLGGGGFFM